MRSLAQLSESAQRCLGTVRALAAAGAMTCLSLVDAIRARAAEFEDRRRTRAKAREAEAHAQERAARDKQPPWTTRPVRTTRDEFAITWHVHTERYSVLAVRIERFPKTLSIDIDVEGDEVLQRVIPVPEEVTDFLPEVCTEPGEVLIR